MLQIGNKVRAKSGDNKGNSGKIIGSVPLLSSNPLKMMETQRELAKQGREILWTVRFDNGNLDSFEEAELETLK